MLLKNEVAFGLVRDLNCALVCGLVHLCGEHYLGLVSMGRLSWLAIAIDSGDFSNFTPMHRYWTKGKT